MNIPQVDYGDMKKTAKQVAGVAAGAAAVALLPIEAPLAVAAVTVGFPPNMDIINPEFAA